MRMYSCSECIPRRYFVIEDGVTIACPACRGRQYSPAEDADAVLAQFRARLAPSKCICGYAESVRDADLAKAIWEAPNLPMGTLVIK